MKLDIKNPHAIYVTQTNKTNIQMLVKKLLFPMFDGSTMLKPRCLIINYKPTMFDYRFIVQAFIIKIPMLAIQAISQCKFQMNRVQKPLSSHSTTWLIGMSIADYTQPY